MLKTRHLLPILLLVLPITIQAHDDKPTVGQQIAALPASAIKPLVYDWKVDPAQSSLTFEGTYQGEKFQGKFKKFDAIIGYEVPEDLSTAKFDVKVDVGSVDTTSSERDDSLKGEEFFDPKKFPQAHFVTDSFTKGADGNVEAKGKLTIRDKTQSVTLKVKFAANGDKATLDVDTVLKRADFGLGAGKDWNDIGADVPVHGHLVLTGK